MLKIYLRCDKYKLQNSDKVIPLSTRHNLCIVDESDAVDHVKEFDAYAAEAFKTYNDDVEFKKTRKGMKAIYWTYDGPVYAKQWMTPNTKLVVHSSYEEHLCSMKRLMDLPTVDVIAYLKQEGMITLDKLWKL